MVQRPELEERDRLGEVQVLAHDFVIQDLAWFEDVRSAEVGLVVLLKQRPPVREHYRIIVNIHHPSLRLDSLSNLVGVLRRGQPRPAVEELGEARLTGNEAGHANQEVPMVPGKLVYLRCDLLKPPDDLAVNLVVVLTTQSSVVRPGDTRLGGVDVHR
jgi:hypothetical protein